MNDFLIKSPILPQCRVSIVIPVRNEAESILETLQAFAIQKDSQGKPLDFDEFEIIVLANNCTDNSAEIISEFKKNKPEINLHIAEISLSDENANIGFVRRILMNEAFARLKQNAKTDGVIMTTDGDTIVAENWIAANLQEIENGADAVGGRIFISAEELEKMNFLCREIHLEDEEYRLLTAEIEGLIDDLPFDKNPRHHQHFNGSFAVKIEAFEKAGGIPHVKFLEDVAFFDALNRVDGKIRHSPHVKVFTSSRHVGRSEVGLSFQLNHWKNLKEAGENFLVESAESIIDRFSAKKLLRKIWSENFSGNLIDKNLIFEASEKLFLNSAEVKESLSAFETFGAFYESLIIKQSADGKRHEKFPPASVDKALKDLKIEIKKYRAQSFSQTSIR